MAMSTLLMQSEGTVSRFGNLQNQAAKVVVEVDDVNQLDYCLLPRLNVRIVHWGEVRVGKLVSNVVLMFDTSGVTDPASNELGKNRLWRQDFIEKSLFLLQCARGSSNILKWTESSTRRGFWTNIYLTQGTKH